MSYSVTELKSDLEAAFHGTSTNKMRNLYGAMGRAARRVLADFDPAETIRVVPLASPFYSGVHDYACMADLKNDRIIDVRKLGQRTVADGFNQTYSKPFDQAKGDSRSGVLTSIRWNGMNKSLRVAVPYVAPLVLTDCADTSGWVVGGTASNLVLDTVNYFEGSSSFRFDVSTGVGYVENVALDAIDLSTIDKLGALFGSVFLASGTGLTSVVFRFGSSAADYWEVTMTNAFPGNVFQQGWNVIGGSWPTTHVGSPDSSNVTRLRVTVTASAPITALRLDSVTAQLGAQYESEYYSKFLFRDSSGTFKEKVTADSDLINLDTDSFEVYFACLCWILAQQLQGLDANMADGPYNEQNYMALMDRYVLTHKSQVVVPTERYYTVNKPLRFPGR